jgi:FtsH-binding integral membrane protein
MSNNDDWKKTQMGWGQPPVLPPPAPLPPPRAHPYPTYPQYEQQHAQQQYAQQQYAQQSQYPPQQPQYAQQQQPYPYQQPYYGQQAAHIVQQMHAAEQHQQQSASKPGKQRPIANANATQGVSNRVRFIRLTYLHLLGAILAFSGLLWLLTHNAFLATKVSAPLVKFALGGRWNWGIVLAVFMAVSWVADYWASHATSKTTQYLGLAFYIVAEALIFVPLLAIVAWKTAAIVAKGGGDPNIIRDSAYVTLGIFAALTASVFITKKDFSFLRSGLFMASGAALMLVVLSLTFGFNLGLAFSVGMVLLAAAYILYQTSQVLAHYDPNQHVAASLALFSSVALMFWYVIRIFMRMRAE